MDLLRKFWKGFKKGWMKFAHFIGKVNSTILLSILYFLIIGIYSIVARFVFLIMYPFKKKHDTHWISRNDAFDPESFKHPF